MQSSLSLPALAVAALLTVVARPATAQSSTRLGAHPGTYQAVIESHLETLITAGADRYGSKATPMWMSSLDTRSRTPLKGHKPERVYRLIGAPDGVTFYWDQPLLVAAHELSQWTGNPRWGKAAREYVASYLECCVKDNGLVLWGNHQYYDAHGDSVVHFSGGYHELRPLSPSWEFFWEHDPALTERYIRTMVRRHLFDAETGGFNRHDNATREHAFIEAGGVLVESLAWLYGKTRDRELLDTALKIARYSFQHRAPTTGLMANEPDKGRWDAEVSTSEVGVWAQSLLKAATLTGSEEFTRMAREALLAYLRYGYDAESRRYYGQVGLADGQHVVPEEAGHWPGQYANPWNANQWPTHDYLAAVGEASLTLFGRTGEREFREAAERIASIIMETLPDGSGPEAYAGHYGTNIHFLARAGRVLGRHDLRTDAETVAAEALARLDDGGVLQTRAGTHTYESVGGAGYLLLGLMYLETGKDTEHLLYLY